MGSIPSDITGLLSAARAGDRTAEDRLLGAAYTELKKIARRCMRSERRDHTLQPTALIHEAYVRLTENRMPDIHDRNHFFGLAARVMRQILVDYARMKSTTKRGGDVVQSDRDNVQYFGGLPLAELLALDHALTRLSRMNSRQGAVVELRFFGGLTDEEVAAALQVSVRTVKRDWAIAKAWLYAQLR